MAVLGPVACAQQPATPAPADDVTAITLERGCFGCAGTTLLVLQRDGLATFTTAGSARHGTVGHRQAGHLQPADFQALVRQARAQGIFDLPDRIDDAQQRDGAWRIVRLIQPGRDKEVFWREGVEAPGLAAFTTAIEAVRHRIDFGPSR